MCEVNVDRTCSNCNETKQMTCSLATERLESLTTDSLRYSYECDTPCDETLDCGHPCNGNCFNWYELVQSEDSSSGRGAMKIHIRWFLYAKKLTAYIM